MSDDQAKTFTFNFDVGVAQEKDLNLRIEALEVRIGRIIERGEIDNWNVLAHLMSVTQGRRDFLGELATMLGRLAPLAEEYDDLKKKKIAIETLQRNKDWTLATFADFGADLDNLVIDEED